jgi:hypothetical protein
MACRIRLTMLQVLVLVASPVAQADLSPAVTGMSPAVCLKDTHFLGVAWYNVRLCNSLPLIFRSPMISAFWTELQQGLTYPTNVSALANF